MRFCAYLYQSGPFHAQMPVHIYRVNFLSWPPTVAHIPAFDCFSYCNTAWFPNMIGAWANIFNVL